MHLFIIIQDTTTHISVIIPAYNMANHLPDAIDSVRQSNVGKLDIELFVVDDGSSDHTADAVKKLIRDRAGENPAIQYMCQENQGKSVAINTALNKAKGQYIAILDADDKLPKDSLKLRYQRVKETGADLILGGFLTFNGNHVLGYRPPPSGNKYSMINALLFDIKSPFHQNSMLISRALIEKVGFFDRRLLRGQDKDYAIRLLKTADTCEVIDKPVYLYRRYKRGYLNRLKNRLLTMRFKWVLLAKHTRGIKRTAALIWGVFLEVGKVGYELFSFYKR